MVSRDLSSKSFIGREAELLVFRKMLSQPASHQQILYLVGDGGSGKTSLLDQFTLLAQEGETGGSDSAIVSKLIDFYWTGNRREMGVLDSLATSLAPAGDFSVYWVLSDRYHYLESTGFDPESQESLAKKAREQFIAAYELLPKDRRIVLLFDTAELAGEALDEFWTETLPKLRSNTMVVIAGRRRLSRLPTQDVIWMHIAGFSELEIRAYLRSYGIDADDHSVRRIAELSDGRPLLVALVVDWVNNGHALSELESSGSAPRNRRHKDRQANFEGTLVEFVKELKYPEDQAIYAMAHLYRRFNEEILGHILDMSPAESERIVSSLQRFTFVKYRPAIAGQAESSCTLHDEMRDLVVKYDWFALDPMGTLRRSWSRRIVQYYSDKLKNETDRLERQNLGLERLHYWFQFDIDSAFDAFHEDVEWALELEDTDFAISLKAELAPYEALLPQKMRREIDFLDAWIDWRRAKNDDARDMFEQLVKVADPGLLEARALAYLVPICTNTGRPQDAITYGNNCKELCEQFAAQIPETQERQQFLKLRALVDNNLGYTYRYLGNLDRAIECYERVLESIRVGLPMSLIARVRNNLGFAYFRKGRINESLQLVKGGLRLRLHLDIPDEISLSYNVLGMLYGALDRDQEADWAFREALEYASKAKNPRNTALICIAYGKLLRQLGWYRETPGRASVIDGERFFKRYSDATVQDPEEQISANPSYKQAKRLYNEAREILEAAGEDEKDATSLSEVFNEIGCLYRQVDAFDIAVEYLNKSIAQAQQVGNIFREADSLLDLAITCFRRANMIDARNYAEKAKERARQEGHNYLIAKSQHLLAILAFRERDYDTAFECAEDACVNVIKQRSKPRAFDDVLESVSSMIRQLPSIEMVEERAQSLIDRWNQEKLTQRYPGLITEMKSLMLDYSLAQIEVGEQNEQR